MKMDYSCVVVMRLMVHQASTDAVWRLESHSHRGFSPVVKAALSQAPNRFSGNNILD
jgi:hypothetical protein